MNRASIVMLRIAIGVMLPMLSASLVAGQRRGAFIAGPPNAGRPVLAAVGTPGAVRLPFPPHHFLPKAIRSWLAIRIALRSSSAAEVFRGKSYADHKTSRVRGSTRKTLPECLAVAG